jgi:hypothetical protein
LELSPVKDYNDCNFKCVSKYSAKKIAVSLPPGDVIFALLARPE